MKTFAIRPWGALMGREQLIEYCDGECAVRELEKAGLEPSQGTGKSRRWWKQDVDNAIARLAAAKGEEK